MKRPFRNSNSPRRMAGAVALALVAWLVVAPAMPVRAAEPEISFSVGTDVPEEDEVYVREGIQLVQDYIETTFPESPPPSVIVNVRHSSEASDRHTTAFSGGSYIVVFTKSRGWTTLAPFDRVHVVVHEYIHSWQREQFGDGAETVPTWLIEGMAEYLGYDAVIDEGLVREQEVIDFHAWSLLDSPEIDPLDELEARDAFYGEFGPVYSLAYVAVARLLEDGSIEEIERFQALVESGVPWEEAFAEAFGQAVDDFYAEVEDARDEVIAPREAPEPFAGTGPKQTESRVIFSEVPEMAALDEQVTVLARTEPDAICTARLRSAESGERLSRTTFADGAGRVFWLITIPPDFGEGPADLLVSCGDDGSSREVTIVTEAR